MSGVKRKRWVGSELAVDLVGRSVGPSVHDFKNVSVYILQRVESIVEV